MEDRLQKFAHLVDAGSFTKAAEELHISQPALSAAVKKLERELKAPLLQRTNPLQPTEAGNLAYTAAKELGASLSSLTLKLTELAQQKPTLALGMIDSVADAFFERGAGFELLEQQARISVTVNNSRHLAQGVARGELDVAFVAEQSHGHEPLAAVTVGVEPLILVCHPERYIATVQALRSGALPRFIGYDQSSTTSQLVQSVFARHGIRPHTLLHSTSPEVMLKLVLAQKGAAVLPYLLVKPALGGGKLEPLRIGASFILERKIVALRYRNRVLPNAAETATGELRHALDKLMAEANRLR